MILLEAVLVNAFFLARTTKPGMKPMVVVNRATLTMVRRTSAMSAGIVASVRDAKKDTIWMTPMEVAKCATHFTLTIVRHPRALCAALDLDLKVASATSAQMVI